MNNKVSLLHEVWDKTPDILTKKRVSVGYQNFDQFLANVFCPGPSYFFVIDFFDRSIAYISESVKNIHGLEPASITFNDIIAAIHPDDMDFVAQAEQVTADYLLKTLGRNKLVNYKTSYCFRMKTANGAYALFQHQVIILATDEHGAVAKALNVHSNIDHLTNRNNHQVAITGMFGESFFHSLEVANFNQHHLSPTTPNIFTARETEIIRLISQGLTSAQIAAVLTISEETVKTHRKKILSKSGCKNVSQLVAYCTRLGLA